MDLPSSYLQHAAILFIAMADSWYTMASTETKSAKLSIKQLAKAFYFVLSFSL
jgi:hypothetical protein